MARLKRTALPMSGKGRRVEPPPPPEDKGKDTNASVRGYKAGRSYKTYNSHPRDDIEPFCRDPEDRLTVVVQPRELRCRMPNGDGICGKTYTHEAGLKEHIKKDHSKDEPGLKVSAGLSGTPSQAVHAHAELFYYEHVYLSLGNRKTWNYLPWPIQGEEKLLVVPWQLEPCLDQMRDNAGFGVDSTTICSACQASDRPDCPPPRRPKDNPCLIWARFESSPMERTYERLEKSKEALRAKKVKQAKKAKKAKKVAQVTSVTSAVKKPRITLRINLKSGGAEREHVGPRHEAAQGGDEYVHDDEVEEDEAYDEDDEDDEMDGMDDSSEQMEIDD